MTAPTPSLKVPTAALCLPDIPSPDFDSNCGFSQKNINNINESVSEISKV